MTDILAVFHVEHPDLALTTTAANDPSAVIRPVREAGTDPKPDRSLFSVRTSDFERFESGLTADETVAEYECVTRTGEEAVYAFTYTDEAVLFSTEVGRVNGVVLNVENEGTTWILKTWFPDRDGAQRLWSYAVDNDIDIELDRINEYGSIVPDEYGLTETQRNALLVALDEGHFDVPRGATLGEVATELDISKPAASGLVRRAMKRLVLSTLAESRS
ncbi:helix-turn-helix domain-containing protein [Haloarculaceae archaeon H-GB2-1]|nr:helix-turn-helix domain-containing protein [Haloarculaceae archaeon H-GB1-1]MEA5387795.1 helix-turn-helix domain-containing protein [Haloarculaceae archaeon H-GB11]MEA5409294.1 helix-turn-helix domain-containing protein [Haloarculaceae archaeon H-GB2-1]